MNPHDPNIFFVEQAAEALDQLVERVVFVGGCATGLLITDQARPAVRATTDVDLIVEVVSRVDYYALCNDLRMAGLKEDATSGVTCRWRLGALQIDVMPTDQSILGFTNIWYERVISEAQLIALPSGRKVRVVSAPLFIATKLEAFYDRGNEEFNVSHDIEDIINLIDGRPSITKEIADGPEDVAAYLREEFNELLLSRDFMAAIPWHLGGSESEQARAEIIIHRLREIAGM